MPKVRDLIGILKTDYDPDDTIAYSLWTTKDVESLNEQETKNRELHGYPEIDLQQEDIDDILECMHDENYPDQGLNNDSLYSAYLEIIGDPKENDEKEVGIY